MKLQAHGTVKPRQCIVLYFDTHRDNVVLFWSTVMAGGVPVMLSSLSSNEIALVDELNHVSKLFSGPTVLTTKQLAKTFRLSTALTTVAVEVILQVKGEERLAASRESGEPGELAAVLFASGSTGFAKSSQRMMSSKLKCNFHGMDSNKTFISWVSKYFHLKDIAMVYSLTCDQQALTTAPLFVRIIFKLCMLGQIKS